MTYEYAHYGMMMGVDGAIKTFCDLVPDDKKGLLFERAMNRLKYLANRVAEEMPVFHKGIYGKKFDYYTCRSCGKTVHVVDRFYSGCGKEIDWRNAKNGESTSEGNNAGV